MTKTIETTDSPVLPGRRALLKRLGLAVGVAYIAPVALQLGQAHASSASFSHSDGRRRRRRRRRRDRR